MRKNPLCPPSSMVAEDDGLDAESLQAQVDMTMSFAHNLVTSWIKPSNLAQLRSSSVNATPILEEELRRPPRYPSMSCVMDLRNKLCIDWVLVSRFLRCHHWFTRPPNCNVDWGRKEQISKMSWNRIHKIPRNQMMSIKEDRLNGKRKWTLLDPKAARKKEKPTRKLTHIFPWKMASNIRLPY